MLYWLFINKVQIDEIDDDVDEKPAAINRHHRAEAKQKLATKAGGDRAMIMRSVIRPEIDQHVQRKKR